MAKPQITLRLVKGSELTFQEGDDNFANLRDATVTVNGDTGSITNDLNGSFTIAGGTGLTTSVSSTTLSVDLDNTAVTPASYTKASITVDAQGRITAASNGSADFTQSDARTAISVTDSSGDGSLAYDNGTGVITYTGPSASEVRAHFSGGTGITITDGVVATTITQYADTNARTAISVTDAGGEGSLGYDNGTGVITYTGPSFSGLEVTSAKNQNNGYAGLDANGKVASAQLPSYVDDVEEYAAFANFPVTGETSKIYVALDLNKIYRWSGSVYVEISPSPGTTDNVPEGTTNLYFSNTLARSAISAGTGIGYDSGTGVISSTITQYADSNARSAITVTDSGGDGSLGYDNSTGIITYTGPSASDVRAHFSGGTGITITDGVVATTVTSGIADVVADTTPQLGGNLDVNGNSIVSTSDGNITLAPNGSGNVHANAMFLRVGTGSLFGVVTSNGANDLILNTNSGTNSGSISIADGVNGNITILPEGTGKVSLSNIQYPNTNGSNGQVLTTNGSGVASWQNAGGGGISQWAHISFTSLTFGSGETWYGTSNIVNQNSSAWVSVSGNTITFPAGTYLLMWSMKNVNRGTQSFPSNIQWFKTAGSGTTLTLGSWLSTTTTAGLWGNEPLTYFTIAGSTTYRCQQTMNNSVSALPPNVSIIKVV